MIILKKFPIGLEENLREEDNLSTRDNWPVPKVSFVWRFYCIARYVQCLHSFLSLSMLYFTKSVLYHLCMSEKFTKTIEPHSQDFPDSSIFALAGACWFYLTSFPVLYRSCHHLQYENTLFVPQAMTGNEARFHQCVSLLINMASLSIVHTMHYLPVFLLF